MLVRVLEQGRLYRTSIFTHTLAQDYRPERELRMGFAVLDQ